MTSKHMPGPWRACREGDCTCGTVWSIPSDFPVCTAQNVPVALVHEHMADAPDLIYATIPNEIKQANARLIAAAPDLLKALSELLRVDGGAGSECYDAGRHLAARIDCFAAIAKAEGR